MARYIRCFNPCPTINRQGPGQISGRRRSKVDPFGGPREGTGLLSGRALKILHSQIEGI